METLVLKYGARGPDHASVWPLRNSVKNKKRTANKYTLLVITEKG